MILQNLGIKQLGKPSTFHVGDIVTMADMYDQYLIAKLC